MKRWFEKWRHVGAEIAARASLGEKGQTMIEYALVAVLIVIVLVFIFAHSGIDSGISKTGVKVSSALQ
jgi:Flp pilus assembly pilin Flp